MAPTTGLFQEYALLVFLMLAAHGAGNVIDLSATAQRADAQAYLDPHNAARGRVGLAPLVWSDTLAAYALSYAHTQVGRCLPLTHSQGPYGENLFWGSGKAWGPADAVAYWVNEKQFYDHATNSCTGGQRCGHYTQVVWSTTTSVGCAHVLCADGSDYIICSYDPAGNWIGESPY